jgi:hypothetical protein
MEASGDGAGHLRGGMRPGSRGSRGARGPRTGPSPARGPSPPTAARRRPRPSTGRSPPRQRATHWPTSRWTQEHGIFIDIYQNNTILRNITYLIQKKKKMVGGVRGWEHRGTNGGSVVAGRPHANHRGANVHHKAGPLLHRLGLQPKTRYRLRNYLKNCSGHTCCHVFWNQNDCCLFHRKLLVVVGDKKLGRSPAYWYTLMQASAPPVARRSSLGWKSTQ